MEVALGMYRNIVADCPYQDIYSALEDCESMYRQLFLHDKNSGMSRQTNFENSMQKIHRLLQIER